MDRFDRNIRLFGVEGQRRLRNASVAIYGLGGIGSHVNQQLSLLGVGGITQIDHDDFSKSSRNRLIGFKHQVPTSGVKKVDLAAQLVHSIDPDIEVYPVPHKLQTCEAFEVIHNVDHVFGCFDHDGPRFVLNELCMAYGKNYFDLATDVPEAGVYGGRVCISWQGNSCLFCKNQLDMNDVRRYLATPDQLENEAAAYGVPDIELGEIGPSVVSVNGVIASLGVTEFMVAVTGMRLPTELVVYRGDRCRVTVNQDRPVENCPYCKCVWRKGGKTDVERYLNTVLS